MTLDSLENPDLGVSPQTPRWGTKRLPLPFRFAPSTADKREIVGELGLKGFELFESVNLTYGKIV